MKTKQLTPIIFKRAAERMDVDGDSMWAALSFATKDNSDLYNACYDFINNLIGQHADWQFGEYTLAKQIFLDLCALILKDKITNK